MDEREIWIYGFSYLVLQTLFPLLVGYVYFRSKLTRVSHEGSMSFFDAAAYIIETVLLTYFTAIGAMTLANIYYNYSNVDLTDCATKVIEESLKIAFSF
jgi:hypothetical protein